MDHKSDSELNKELADAESKIEVGAKYAHYKSTENTYTVLGLVVIQATQEVGVLYRANYGGKFAFVRPVSSWLESVDGVPRFRKI